MESEPEEDDPVAEIPEEDRASPNHPYRAACEDKAGLKSPLQVPPEPPAEMEVLVLERRIVAIRNTMHVTSEVLSRCGSITLRRMRQKVSGAQDARSA